MPLPLAAAFIAAGLVLLYLGAEGLVRGASALALRLGLPPLIVGLTVVAFGTSSPELVVSVQASLAGRGALAVGNVVGSNIANVAVILGLAACLQPLRIEAQLLRRDVPLLVGVSLLLVGLLADGTLSRLEGAGLFAGLVLYTGASIWAARRTPAPEGVAAAPPAGPAWRDALLLLGGLLMLVLGSEALVRGAVVVAARFGLSEALIGLTIVAVGTSLPELATSAVAALRGEGDIAVGNVVGSNLFNLLGILGIAALVRPLPTPGIGLLDLGLMAALAVALVPLMRTGFRLVRWEGAALLAVYSVYVGLLLG